MGPLVARGGSVLYGGSGMVGGRADCNGRGRCGGVNIGIGVGGGSVVVLLIITVLASCFGVGGSMMSSVRVMNGIDLKRLGMSGTVV